MPEGRGLFAVAREKIRTQHLALRTEQAYLHWMRRYVKFHGRKHPRELGPNEVEVFLTHLAVKAKVARLQQQLERTKSAAKAQHRKDAARIADLVRFQTEILAAGGQKDIQISTLTTQVQKQF